MSFITYMTTRKALKGLSECHLDYTSFLRTLYVDWILSLWRCPIWHGFASSLLHDITVFLIVIGVMNVVWLCIQKRKFWWEFCMTGKDRANPWVPFPRNPGNVTLIVIWFSIFDWLNPMTVLSWPSGLFLLSVLFSLQCCAQLPIGG
jgi:hypothetical protein